MSTLLVVYNPVNTLAIKTQSQSLLQVLLLIYALCVCVGGDRDTEGGGECGRRLLEVEGEVTSLKCHVCACSSCLIVYHTSSQMTESDL